MHSPDLAEYIGGESYSILKYDDDIEYIPTPRAASKSRSRSRRQEASEKEYPPVMRRRPSVLRKYITGDGSLVIKQEKGMSHLNLLAHRSDGRLLLTLQVDDFECPENMDGGDDRVNASVDPTVDKQEELVEEEEEEEVECYNMHCESGVNNPCGGGLAAVAAFGPPLLT